MALSRFINQSLALPVQERSEIGEARRRLTALARQMDWTEPNRARLALVINEACANMVRHARHGQLVMRILNDIEGNGMELLALDRGPGMSSIQRCMQDGYSTGGTAGTGLGALRRLSDAFDIHSSPGVGTAVLMRLWTDKPPQTPLPLQIGAVCVAHRNETECGDAWAMRQLPHRLNLLVVDGLGHGAAASEAAMTAVDVFQRSTLSVEQLLPKLDDSLRRTRGAAIAIAEVEVPPRSLRFWSVGNVVGDLVHGGRHQQLAGQHGTAGLAMPTPQAVAYDVRPGASLVMHTDGLASSWKLAADASLLRHDPALAAGVLYRDHCRERDDVTVVLARTGRSG